MPIDFPNSPTIGDTYTTEGRTWEWDGTVWLALEPPVRFSYVQSTAPEDPIVGSGWFDTTTARFFVYYDGYWVESATSSAFPEVTTPLSYNAETNTVSIDLSEKQDIVSGVSDTEIGYLDGVTSDIQDQLNGKANLSGATFAGEVISNLGGFAQFRATNGTAPGFLVRNDGNATYFLLTADGDPNGSWNSFRPIIINNSNGFVTTTSPATPETTGLRNIVMSTGDPTGGADGDVWLKYTP